MSNILTKYYGRKSVNKLDWLLAIVCCVVALGSVWISVGICLRNAAPAAVPAFTDALHALIFKWNTGAGTSLIYIVISSVLFYEAVLYLVIATICLCKKGKKDRVPGVVAGFIAMLGIIVLGALAFEFLLGSSKGAVNDVWAYGLVGFVVWILALLVWVTIWTFAKQNVETDESECCCCCCEEAKEEAREEVVEEEKEPEPQPEPEPEKEPEPQPEPEPEPEKEPEVKEEVVEESEPEEEPKEEVEAGEEGGDMFSELGSRKRRVPFENKLKRSPQEVLEYYDALKKVLDQYVINDRFSIPGETFSFKREKLVFITFAGNTLKVYFAIDPKEFEGSTIPVKSAADVKKFEDTPSYLRIKSNLATRRAIYLIRRICTERGVPRK